MFSAPRSLVIAGIQINLARNGIYAQGMNGIGHCIQHVERVCVIAARKIRIARTADIDRADKSLFAHATVQKNFGLGRVIERQVVNRRRSRQSLERTCRRELFISANVTDFVTGFYRANRKSLAGTRHHRIHVHLE